MSDPTAQTLLASVADLHDRVEQQATALADLHAERLQCRKGCHACCLDDLTVWPIEAMRIVTAHPDVLQQAPGALGACAFLDETGACRVYDVRPQVCRTQGLPLRYFFETEDDDIEEARDICPLNLEGPALELLDDDDLWTVGIVEHELLSLQDAWDNDAATFEHALPRPLPRDDAGRVPLRALFVRANG